VRASELPAPLDATAATAEMPGVASRLGLLGVECAFLGAGGGDPSLRRRSRRSAAMRSSALPAGDAGGVDAPRQTRACRSSASVAEMGGDARPSSSPVASPHSPQIHRPPYRARTPAMYGAVHSSVNPQQWHATSSSSSSTGSLPMAMPSRAPGSRAPCNWSDRRILTLCCLLLLPVVAVDASSAAACFHLLAPGREERRVSA
jgi:hypothetical protein